MSRSTAQRISDIREAAARCAQYVESLDSADPVIVAMAEDAIERNLQIIGEAANHLPTGLTEAHSHIAWPQIRGLRNILVHQYFGVDTDTVREVVERYLPPVIAAFELARDELE
ncbi:HepT-like ribonuclease domain-containing protein [Leucobacter aridicollis]|uniref:Uncharacterized protein with HEPN domain n=1 Tax=Leucobacter aridicollis TaxID=283878 RepID=A0A852R1J4_9MICO|nr:HepT-like ribonuclease domain-containing protein [Leucobacter aridicollis]MBL3683017.1 DUF86 domain-containing protein [Leucobacter aridicollis]NYD26457.1 uncharacterized protein with HEPN domain [Leucobacter aridicollis]